MQCKDKEYNVFLKHENGISQNLKWEQLATSPKCPKPEIFDIWLSTQNNMIVTHNRAIQVQGQVTRKCFHQMTSNISMRRIVSLNTIFVQPLCLSLLASTYVISHTDNEPIDQSHKAHNALGKDPAMHRFVTEMCTHVHISVLKWYNVRYGAGELWDLWIRSVHPCMCVLWISRES